MRKTGLFLAAATDKKGVENGLPVPVGDEPQLRGTVSALTLSRARQAAVRIKSSAKTTIDDENDST